MSDREKIVAACRSIAKTADGHVLHLYLIRQLLDCPPDGISDGALRSHHGRRNHARELIAMFEDSSGGPIGAEQPTIKPASSGGESAARRGGLRERRTGRTYAPGVGS